MAAADKKKADDDAAKKKADDDKAKADAALNAIPAAVAAKLAAIELRLPADLTDEQRHGLALVQARADEVYMAFGKRAPQAMSGEELLAYRKRLVNQLKVHSPTWKDVDVINLKADAFDVAEKQVLHDATAAALHPADLAEDELRAITKTDSATGIRMTEFVGKRSFVSGMKRPPAFVTRIFTPGAARKEA